MKLDITIKGATLEEARNIIAKLGGSVALTESAPVITPTPVLPVASTAGTAGQTETDDDTQSNTNVAGQVDADGLPWDARIHSSNRKKKADGRWVSRRNVDESTYNQVINELRSAPPVQQPFTPPIAQQPTPAAPMEVPAFLKNMPVGMATPGQIPNIPQTITPPAPLPGNFVPQPPATGGPVNTPQHYAPAQPPAAPAGQTINDLFTKIQQMFQSGTADSNYILSLQNRLSQQFQVQVNSVNDIANRHDMIAAAFQLIAIDGK